MALEKQIDKACQLINDVVHVNPPTIKTEEELEKYNEMVHWLNFGYQLHRETIDKRQMQEMKIKAYIPFRNVTFETQDFQVWKISNTGFGGEALRFKVVNHD